MICHGIPDKRVLVDGDILNIDVTLYHGGFHGDLNETYYIGEKARNDPDSVRVVEAARECLDEAIKLVKPGALFRSYGNVIEKHAKVEELQRGKDILWAWYQQSVSLLAKYSALCQEQSSGGGKAWNVFYY